MARSIADFVPAALAALVMLAACGCGSAPKIPDLDAMFGTRPDVHEEETHRQGYQSSRNPEDLRWLLGNRISSGMTVSEVGRVIGEAGRRLDDDTWIKKGAGHYQSGDKAWKWEQDRNGQSLILVFREGRLVNFDPSAYEQSADSFAF